MSIIKRISAPAGTSTYSGAKHASDASFVCPHCHRQSRLVPYQGLQVCQICQKAPGA